MTLLDVVPAAGEDADRLLRLAGAVEAASEHPIAAAVAARGRRPAPLPPVDGFANVEGLGVPGTVDGPTSSSAAAGCWPTGGLPLPAELARAAAGAEADGRTAIAVGWDGAARGVLVVADAVKPTRRPRRSAQLRGAGPRRRSC